MATFRQREGRWQAIIRRVNLKATKTFDRKIDATTWARALEREDDLAAVTPGKMSGTLASVIDRYERELWPLKRWGGSKAQELDVLRRDLGSRLLSDLSRSVVLTYVRGLKITGGGISSRLSYLREVIKTAHDLWSMRVPLEEVNAAIATARRMKIAGTSLARTRRPTQAEINTIIAFAEGQTRSMIELAPIIRVLAVVPLRVGELLGIQWPDLDEKRRTVMLRNRKHPDVRVREANDQEIPLIEFGGVDTFALVANRPRYLESPFPYKRTSVSSAFWNVGVKCQIHDLHIHDLRAHALSCLLEAGVEIPQVALISGHKDWKMLAKHYARIDPASVHDNIKRVGKISARDIPERTSQRRDGADQP